MFRPRGVGDRGVPTNFPRGWNCREAKLGITFQLYEEKKKYRCSAGCRSRVHNIWRMRPTEVESYLAISAFCFLSLSCAAPAPDAYVHKGAQLCELSRGIVTGSLASRRVSKPAGLLPRGRTATFKESGEKKKKTVPYRRTTARIVSSKVFVVVDGTPVLPDIKKRITRPPLSPRKNICGRICKAGPHRELDEGQGGAGVLLYRPATSRTVKCLRFLFLFSTFRLLVFFFHSLVSLISLTLALFVPPFNSSTALRCRLFFFYLGHAIPSAPSGCNELRFWSAILFLGRCTPQT